MNNQSVVNTVIRSRKCLLLKYIESLHFDRIPAWSSLSLRLPGGVPKFRNYLIRLRRRADPYISMPDYHSSILISPNIDCSSGWARLTRADLGVSVSKARLSAEPARAACPNQYAQSACASGVLLSICRNSFHCGKHLSIRSTNWPL